MMDLLEEPSSTTTQPSQCQHFTLRKATQAFTEAKRRRAVGSVGTVAVEDFHPTIEYQNVRYALAEQWEQGSFSLASSIAEVSLPALSVAVHLDFGRIIKRALDPESQDKSETELSFHIDVLSFLESETVEEGFPHPLENFLALHIERSGESALKWVCNLLQSDVAATLRAGLLHCLSRLPHAQVSSIAESIVRQALHSPIAALREAAIGAVEEWKKPELVSVLRSHTDSVSWLQDYSQKLIEHLTSKRS